MDFWSSSKLELFFNYFGEIKVYKAIPLRGNIIVLPRILFIEKKPKFLLHGITRARYDFDELCS